MMWLPSALRRSACLLLMASTCYCSVLQANKEEVETPTAVHSPGYCAMYGVCGHRQDHDVLSCPNNTLAQPLSSSAVLKLQDVCPQLIAEEAGTLGRYCCTEEQIDVLSRQIAMASVFLVGCPACLRNFHRFFCLLTCSRDQATFTNVTSLQKAFDNNATVVKEVDYYVADHFGKELFNSCKDVVFGSLNQKAMTYVGGGSTNFTQWFEFLGLIKDKRFPPTGSPFQMYFPGEATVPEGMRPMDSKLHSCWDPAYQCSCGDCPSAPTCIAPPPAPPESSGGCAALGLHHLLCSDAVLLVVYGIAIIAILCISTRLLHRSTSVASKTLDDGLLSQEADSEPTASSAQPKQTILEDEDYPWLEQHLRKHFRNLGALCARKPVEVLASCFLLVLFLGCGLSQLRLETDPQRLWVGLGSQALLEKEEYEASFGAFWRVEQLILSTTANSNSPYLTPSGLPSIVTRENINLLFDMQAKVDALAAHVQDSKSGRDDNVTLDGICYKPLKTACGTQSVLQYWQMSKAAFNGGYGPYHQRTEPEFCFAHYSNQCPSAFVAPMDPHLVLGGFPEDDSFRNYTADSSAFVVTYPVVNSPENREAAMAWEAAFVELAKGELLDMARAANLSLSFTTERSVQDELARETGADAGTVALSYLVMLLYIAISLTSLPRGAPASQVLVYSRVSLGVGGVLMVAGAIVGALGLCSMMGVWATLIIMEVIPFLVLAVGVDNMYIIVQALESQPAGRPLPERMGAALASSGPSILLAASCEAVAFLLAATTSMPAVRNFSIVAAVAVLLDLVLQVTAFVALLSLDVRRVEQGRADLVFCLKVQENASNQLPAPEADQPVEPAAVAAAQPEEAPQGEGERSGRVGVLSGLQWYMAHVHAPALAKPLVRLLVLALFLTTFMASLAAIPRISRGLDQRVALPADSYLQDYFTDLAEYLRVGPPLYFVVHGLNVSRNASDVNAICSTAGCDSQSLMNQVVGAASVPHESYIATPAASWLDDFLAWVSPEVPHCCRAFPDGSRCPPPDQPPCNASAAECRACTACFRAGGPPGPDLLLDGRPSVQQVQERLPWFLEALPSAGCAKGGAGAYSDSFAMDGAGSISGLGDGMVSASSFRTYYVTLSSQMDFVTGMQRVRDFVGKVRDDLKLDVYAYSIFHIYFEQYINIAQDSVLLLLGGSVAVFLVCCIFTGSIWGSSIIMAMLGMILVHLLGVMYLWGIQLNAVSLVNLMMALGIAVEFCAHITHTFMVLPGSRAQRARAATEQTAATVLAGITLTKFVGVAVLATARTQIFEVYYFRIFFALVLLGAAHGLVLLPVVLALAGPPEPTKLRRREGCVDDGEGSSSTSVSSARLAAAADWARHMASRVQRGAADGFAKAKSWVGQRVARKEEGTGDGSSDPLL